MINTKFSHVRDGKWIEVPEIKKIAEQLVERYQYQSEQYEILKEENDKLKNGVWKKEEISKLKNERDLYKQQLSFGFGITKEENDKLKNGVWEKEEISKLKSERDLHKQQLFFGFCITKEENNKIKQWISNRETKDTGAIGGRYEYRFFPTGIGIICKIVDTTDGESFVFRDI